MIWDVPLMNIANVNLYDADKFIIRRLSHTHTQTHTYKYTHTYTNTHTHTHTHTPPPTQPHTWANTRTNAIALPRRYLGVCVRDAEPQTHTHTHTHTHAHTHALFGATKRLPQTLFQLSGVPSRGLYALR